jgi:hypothetical protein
VVSCRKSVTEASGVVDLYQSDRSYCRSGVTCGAQAVVSVIRALRSPSARRVSETFIALVPECASATVSNVKSLSPQPDLDQQAGMSPVPAVSKPGLEIRLGGPAWAVCGTDISSAVVMAPTASRAVLRLRRREIRSGGGMSGFPSCGSLPGDVGGVVQELVTRTSGRAACGALFLRGR